MIEDHPSGAAAASHRATPSTRAPSDRSIALAAGAIAAAGGLVGWATGNLIVVLATAAVVTLLAGILARWKPEAARAPQESTLVGFIERSNRVLRVARRHRRKAGMVSLRIQEVDAIEADPSAPALAAARDELLVRIRTALRASDEVVATNNDRFAVFLAEVRDDGSLPIVVEKILRLIGEPFAASGTQLRLRGSAGAAMHPDHGTSALDLLSMAGRARHIAERIQVGWVLYSPRIEDVDDENVTLASGLTRAIDRNELLLHYQPQVDLRDGRVRSIEVLLRWQHPQRGTLQPSDFLGVVEHSAVIRGIARYVLEGALLQCARWVDAGMDVRVAVNLSGRNLLDPDLPTMVAGLLERSKLAAKHLEIEISESDLPDAGRSTFAVLQDLHDLGVRVTIDDFGTGTADLALLRHLPVDQIKIDRSFVLTMDADDDLGTIVRSAIAVGRSLGVEVAAEGVATEKVWDELIDLRCDAVQGYFVSRPVPAERLFGDRPQLDPLV